MKRTIDSQGNVEELTPREARQGLPGAPVLYVLLAALALAGIVMAATIFWSHATDPVANTTTKGVSFLLPQVLWA